MATGWKKVQGYWYYMNDKGVMQTGWLNYGYDKYYLAPEGDMKVGWVEVGKDKYFMNHDGVMQVGLIEVNGEVYYLGADGKMATGKTKIGSKEYEFAKTGESIGKLTPKPGKSFDMAGYTTAITVEGGSSSGSNTSNTSSNTNSTSSGGTTIVYVPVGSGNNGNNSGSTTPGGTTEKPGGTTDIPSDLTTQQEQDRLDDYLEQQVALYGKDYYRDFTVSFNRSTHIVDITIQNPDKRIVNMGGLGLQRMIGDYDNGKITQFSINDCAYHNLYVMARNRRVYAILVGYASEFQKTASDVNITDTLRILDGKSVKMTLRNENTTYKSYTFRFTVSSATYKDDITYYMDTNIRDDSGKFSKALCVQNEKGILVSLSNYNSLIGFSLENFIYNGAYYNYLGWNTEGPGSTGDRLYGSSYSQYDNSDRRADYAKKETSGNTDTYIFYNEKGREVVRYQIQKVDDDHILLLGMNLNDFNNTHKVEKTEQYIGYAPYEYTDPIEQQEHNRFAQCLNDQIDQLSQENYRDFTVSIDNTNHVIDFEIKNPNKRIFNLFDAPVSQDENFAYALTKIIGDYDNGSITQFSINNCGYHNLYVMDGGLRSYVNIMDYSVETYLNGRSSNNGRGRIMV